MSRKNMTGPPSFLTTKPTFNRNRHIKLFHEMLESPAWIVLDHGAQSVYISILAEYKGNYTGNRVKCPYDTMRKHGIRTQSIPKWLVELEALGFIKITTRGGMYKIPNEYLLVAEWAKIKTVEDALTTKESAIVAYEAERKRKAKESVDQGTG